MKKNGSSPPAVRNSDKCYVAHPQRGHCIKKKKYGDGKQGMVNHFGEALTKTL